MRRPRRVTAGGTGIADGFGLVSQFLSGTYGYGGVSLVNYGTSRKLSDLIESAISPLGTVLVTVNLKSTKQTLMGFGGETLKPAHRPKARSFLAPYIRASATLMSWSSVAPSRG